jgi:murein DD-endopeptidase MepM/ murein hydrolase activator NlpD
MSNPTKTPHLLACAVIAAAATATVRPVAAAESVAPAADVDVQELHQLWDRLSGWSMTWSMPDFASGESLQGLLDRMVRAQIAVRDSLRSAEAQLVSLSTGFAHGNVSDELRWTSIDLSVLTADPVPGRQSSGFGWRSDPINHNAKFHRGTDVRAPHGTPIDAAGNGVVIFAGKQNGYGNVVYIDHGGGLITRYGHMQKILAQKDQVVAAGQQIGKVGSTGRATGPHLHFEVRLDGRAVNPIAAMEIAEMKRNGDEHATLAMMALSPERQDAAFSAIDPPRSGKHSKAKGSRPERTGRGKRVKRLS